jgi:carbon-monoxide dehydrogenase large subunit
MATNKPGIVPYRGVARAGVCYALESVMDDLAQALGMSPVEIRLRNLPGPEGMPFTNITHKYFDSGDYPECLRRAVAALDAPLAQPDPNKRRGVGVAIFCEQAAHGTSVYHGWGIPMVPGHEQAAARMTPDGGLEIRVGIHSHGQGLETTLAQVAHQILGLPLERIQVVHGDTGVTPYSTGTWGSRCMVMAGGAVATACKELIPRLRRIGAHLLQAPEDQAVVEDGFVRAGGAELALGEIARTWYRAPQNLPADVSGGGLEVVAGYRARRDTGTFSYAAHAVVVEVDLEWGAVRLVDYAICEDGGVLVNPMIVDGQVIGGVAQGIGTALYEEMPFDAFGQPGATTLADYMLPGATEVPTLRIEHMETPSPLTEFGQKGVGEGGAIGPPAAIACAVNNALRSLGARIDRLPITPERVLAALAEAAQ